MVKYEIHLRGVFIIYVSGDAMVLKRRSSGWWWDSLDGDSSLDTANGESAVSGCSEAGYDARLPLERRLDGLTMS